MSELEKLSQSKKAKNKNTWRWILVSFYMTNLMIEGLPQDAILIFSKDLERNFELQDEIHSQVYQKI